MFQARWPQGSCCPRCGYQEYFQPRSRKTLQCIRCKLQTSLTAGTVFENTKLGLSNWYLAMYLLTQSKNAISAMDLKRQLGVSYNSAWRVKHKLMQAMRGSEDCQLLRGIVELDDAYLGGEGKLGRGAARKTPFAFPDAPAPTEGARPGALATAFKTSRRCTVPPTIPTVLAAC